MSAKPLTDEEFDGITKRTLRGAVSNTTSQDRMFLLMEVRRLREENRRLVEAAWRVIRDHDSSGHVWSETVVKLRAAIEGSK